MVHWHRGIRRLMWIVRRFWDWWAGRDVQVHTIKNGVQSNFECLFLPFADVPECQNDDASISEEIELLRTREWIIRLATRDSLTRGLHRESAICRMHSQVSFSQSGTSWHFVHFSFLREVPILFFFSPCWDVVFNAGLHVNHLPHHQADILKALCDTHTKTWIATVYSHWPNMMLLFVAVTWQTTSRQTLPIVTPNHVFLIVLTREEMDGVLLYCLAVLTLVASFLSVI